MKSNEKCPDKFCFVWPAVRNPFGIYALLKELTDELISSVPPGGIIAM